MKYLALVGLVACASAPAPASKAPPPAPVAATPPPPDDGRPKWIGVVFDQGTARIAQVIPGSPAYDAGIRRDDVVSSFDGQPITIGQEVPPLVQQHAIGTTATIVVKRATGDQKLQLHIQARPDVNHLTDSLVGKPAPAITLPLHGGGTFELASLRGHVVVLDFWATWCGPCVAEIPHYEALQQAMPDLRVVGVASEDEDALRAQPTMYPVARDDDGNAWREYLVMAVPTTFVIDERGIIRHVEVGLGDPNAIDKAIANLRPQPSP